MADSVDDGREHALLHDPLAKCPLCKRNRTAKNRCPSHRSGPYLQFVYPCDARSVCLSCSVSRTCCKGTRIDDIERNFKEDQAKQAQWNKSVLAWEDAYAASKPGGRIRNAANRLFTPTRFSAHVHRCREGSLLYEMHNTDREQNESPQG